jgi:iron complex outermembrane recepter protein
VRGSFGLVLACALALAAPAGAQTATETKTEAEPETAAGSDTVDETAGTGEAEVLDPVRVEDDVADEETATSQVDGYVAKRVKIGTKTDTPVIEVPQSISIITSDQIRDQKANTIEETLRYTAGVRAEVYGLDNRGDWFSLRGGSEGTMLVDGLRQPIAGIWGSVANEPYAFDRIEVLRGPSSVMAGANGPGGTINLVSKFPLLEGNAFGEILGELGNHQHRVVGFDLGGPVDGVPVLFRLVGYAKYADTQVEYTNEERYLFFPSVTFLPTDTTTFTLYAQYQYDRSNNNTGFFPWEGMIYDAPYGSIDVDTFIGEPSWDTHGGDRIRAGYLLTQELGENWQLRHNLRYDRVDGKLKGMYADAFGITGSAPVGQLNPDKRTVDRLAYAQTSHTKILSTDLFLEGHVEIGPTQHTLLAGVDAYWFTEEIPSAFAVATPLDVYDPVYGTFSDTGFEYEPDPGSKARQIGLTLQDQVKILERLVFVGTVRRDYARQTTWSQEEDPVVYYDAWTTRAGLVYLFDHGIAPYLSYSESFQLTTGLNRSNSPFKPLRGKQYEIGVKWAPPNERVSAILSGFWLREKNRLTPDRVNPFFSAQGGELTSKGVELEVLAELPTETELIFAYTWTDSRTTKGADELDPLVGHRTASEPAHKASAWLKQDLGVLGLHGISVGAGVRYVSHSWDGTDTIRVPSNTLVDAMISYERGPWLFAFNVSNLTDETYLATCLDRGDCWFGLQREMTGTVTYSW